MKISHEVPLVMLEESRSFNDYDYALVHLFDQYPEYLEFYKTSLKQGRMVYLDNSVFELEKMFDHFAFAKRCAELASINSENFYYIIPDALEDKDTTCNSFEEFTKTYVIDGNVIGVVQGKNEKEVIECFKFMKEHADVVAISFDYSFWVKSENICLDSMQGRIQFMHKLKDMQLLDNVKIHLLGCFLPQEFSYYKDIPEIFSIDTSNPIVHGIKGIKYTDEGLQSKERIKLNDLFKTSEIPEDVYYNIRKFREFIS